MNTRTAQPNPRGIALITALVMLLIISVIAIAGARLAIGSKRMASNQRDRDLAQQAAEADCWMQKSTSRVSPRQPAGRPSSPAPR